MESLQRNCCFTAVFLFIVMQIDWIWQWFPKEYRLWVEITQGFMLLGIIILTGVMIWAEERERFKRERQ